MIDSIDLFYKDIVSEFAKVPVFEKYEMTSLYDKLEQLSNYDLYNFVSILTTRYKDAKYLLDLDKKNLLKLSDIIMEKIKDVDPTIKISLLNNISNTIQKLVNE